jgi:hypothetical protein
MNDNLVKLVVLCAITALTSCGPVHRFTRIKKIPREYSLNYCGGEIKAPKTDLNKEPWIVFSDREKNQTYNYPGGKVKMKDVDYLDAFLVIERIGEYLRLIKYTPDMLKNGKLAYKKAEYYGWMHKSKLLLNQQSVTDIAGAGKNKMLVVFSDTLFAGEPDKYFVADSVKTHKDLEMNTSAGAISPYSIVYQLKLSENKTQTLIAKRPYLKPETIREDVLGWVDNTLIKDIGTGLHVNLASIPDSSLQFVERKEIEVPVTEDITEASQFLAGQYKTIRYSPVLSYAVRDSLIAFRTRRILPLFDYSNNYVFNVSGERITHKKFRNIVKSLKKINISYVFEGKGRTIAQFPQIVNALQNLQPVFEQAGSFEYQFNFVMNFDAENRTEPLSLDLTSDYSTIINQLSAKLAVKDELKPVASSRSWSSLRKAVDMLDNHQDATNLIVLIGETRYEESVDSILIGKLSKNNCRIAAFQVYSGTEDAYDNFVLDVENMIRSYANGMIKTKQDILVLPEQVKQTNYYRRIETNKNSFVLDFPNNSITQGYLFFPQKHKSLPMELLANDVDTILQQIKNDNNRVISDVTNAFDAFGNNRTQYDNLYARNYGLDGIQVPAKELISLFRKDLPGWYLPSKIVVLNRSANNSVDYRLMLYETELKALKEFVQSLSGIEIDSKYQAKAKKDKKKQCNCPEDNLFSQIEDKPENGSDNDDIPRKCANTKKARENIYNQYLKTITYCQLCKEKGKKLKSLMLAEAQRRITGCPTNHDRLNTIRMKDIKNKKKVPDKMLDDLIHYFKKKLNDLEKAEPFESNGEIYYWVDRKLLP